MSKKKELGQFFTTNSEYITSGLLNIFPKGATIVDPCAGNWDLLNLVKDKFKVEAYDIDPKNKQTEKRDSILNPPNFGGKWIFTNPPYLYKSRAKEKLLFEKYHTDDLYKASMLTMLEEAEGGVLIIPLNFFCASDKEIRKKFLSEFEVKKLKIFEKTVFADTDIPVCAFSFVRKENTEQVLNTTFLPQGKKKKFHVKYDEGYTIGAEIFNLKQSNIEVKRLINLKEKPALSYLHLRCIDTGTEQGKVEMFWSRERYFGHEDRRGYITLTFNEHIPIKFQKSLIIDFNKKLNKYRKQYRGMFLPSFKSCGKDMIKKRIGYKTVYTLVSNILYEYGF